MIVVAIIGILAAVAIPQYSIYTVRAKVTEGLLMMGPAKALVTENAINAMPSLDYGSWTFISADVGKVTDVDINGSSGDITITFGTEIEPGATIIFKPESDGAPIAAATVPPNLIDWRCDAVGSSLDIRYRPAECRQ